ncbi:MAG TPA: M23 family metallopeptidase [Nitrospirales bacterium]|jgi:murein DD-endopeptidase MepM/ murein hydrolase activator NlpD
MNHSEYEIVVFPGATSAPRRFRIKRRTVSILLITSLVAAILECGFLAQYVIRSGEIWELQTLRTEATEHRVQATAMSTGMEDIRKQLSTMREINVRLRVMLGLDPPKSGPMAPGVGGKEESEVTVAPDALSAEGRREEGAPQLQERLAWLSREAGDQERYMLELNSIVDTRRAQWAATPSIWPVRGWISSKFGHRISPFTGKETMHGGIDISAPMHTPIVAAAGGTVILAQFEAGLGNAVVVSHGYGIKTTYGHLAKVKVRPGQVVIRGDVIGWVGSTGLSTGPHLHYEVEHRGAGLDPLKFIVE